MERKDRIDALGATILVGFSFLMGLNQVTIKLVNDGFSPVFQAGLRSACALVPVLLFAIVMRRRLTMRDGSLVPGLFSGTLFAVEFMLLFTALEYTAVSRASVFMYTMPVWVALGAHFLIPGEHLTPRRGLGLVLAVLGVGVALLDEPPSWTPNAFLGDMMCLAGAMCWAGIALTARATNLSRSSAEMQLIYQLVVSAPVLLAVALFIGGPIREPTSLTFSLFAFQVIVVVSIGFLSWFWILRIYPASDMTSFSFLAPLFGVLASWVVLGEELSPSIFIALGMVGGGIALISWRRKPAMVAS
ncbi:DMT family transporter [Hwanghaeella sp.]|uniref:DMT family transporter n=1 Tax=Hwanghaeella sp. TaxID=2605943 RepID=UPI003CCBFC12